MVKDSGQPLKHVPVGDLLVVHCSWLKVGCCITIHVSVMLFITLVKIVLRPVSIFNDSAWLDDGLEAALQLHS